MSKPDKPRVTRIWQQDARTLGLAWTSGRTTLHDVVELRRRCPCAVCVDETSGVRRLVPEDVPETIRPVTVSSVGRYALTVAFDDGHTSGIYTFDLLHDRWRRGPNAGGPPQG